MKRFIRLFSAFLALSIFSIIIVFMYLYKRTTSVNSLLNTVSILLIVFTFFSLLLSIFLAIKQERMFRYLESVIDDLKNSQQPKPPSVSDKDLFRLFFGIKEIYRILRKNIRALEKEEEKMRFIINALDDGIVLLKRERIELINFKAKELLSIEKGDGNIIDALSKHTFIRIMERVLEEDKVEDEFRIEGKWFLVRSRKFGKRTIVVFRDITKQKDYTLLKSTFFENASHELKTPIMSILGYSETLLNEEVSNETKEKFLKYIHSSAKHLADLVEDILTLHKLERQKIPMNGECCLSELEEEIKATFESKACQKEIDFIVVCNEVRVNIPCSYLKSIIWNLVDNALKYTNKGYVKIECSVEGGELLIRVSDTGRGIESKHLPYIFDRFYTTYKDDNGKIRGTGLGLAIVKHITHLYRGSINVKTKPLKGSEFTVRLPLKTT